MSQTKTAVMNKSFAPLNSNNPNSSNNNEADDAWSNTSSTTSSSSSSSNNNNNSTSQQQQQQQQQVNSFRSNESNNWSNKLSGGDLWSANAGSNDAFGAHLDEYGHKELKGNFKTKWSHDDPRINYNSNDLINDNTWNPFLSNPIATAVNSTNSDNHSHQVQQHHHHNQHHNHHPQQQQHVNNPNSSHHPHHHFNNQWSQQNVDPRQVNLISP